MKRAVEVTINPKKSRAFIARGIAMVDGIEVPFTAYQTRLQLTQEDGGQITLRTKSGILETYSDKDHIKTCIKNKVRCWWIDWNREIAWRLTP